MEQTDSGFYVIDVLNLKQPAGKPFHVEARLRGRTPLRESNAADRHAAFIEDRVCRLRRRSSRVRAVCAATRQKENGATTSKRSRITETMKHAELNRREILERQIRACAEAVAHAKEVARVQNERVAKMTASRKAALDERIRLTSLRRQKLLTTPRSRLLEPQFWDDEELLAPLVRDSVVCIQQWWRKLKIGPCLRAVLRTKMSLRRAHELPFEKLMKMMQSPVYIKATARLLARLEKVAGPATTVMRNPSRVFLSAYMLAAHPRELMPAMGEDEEALQAAAKIMLRDFETWIAAFNGGRGYQEVFVFWNSWCEFYQAFQNWKERDSRKIIDGMIEHFIQLDRLWLSVKDQVDAETQWAPRITEHQQKLQDKLSKFGSAALERLATERAALRLQYDQEQEREAAAQEPSEDILSSSPQLFPSGFSSPRRTDSVSPARTRHTVEVPPVAPNVVPKRTRSPVGSMDASDPQLAAFAIGNQLNNAQLAHELVMDPEFELKPAKRSQLEEQVRTVAKKAFFDQVKEEFSQGRFGAHVPVFIEEIRKTLLSMVAEHGKVAENIKESLDLELIKQQIDNNVFDITKCITYVTQKMLQLCAPVRDPHIRAIAQSPDYATAFERVLEVLEEMKIDLANYRLQSLRPVLQQQAVEYEKTKFNEALSSGEESLMKTEAWLSSAVQALANVSASRNPERIESPDHRVAYENAYNEALLSLVFSNMPVSLNSLPETLKMDAERLFGFQNEAQAIAIVAALVMLSRNTVPDLRDDSAALISLKDALLVLLRDEGTTVDNLSMQVISTLNQFLERKPGNGVKKLSVDQEGLLRSMVEKTLSYRDPVFSLISRRVQTCIRQQLEKGQFRRDSLPSQGLDVIQKELESLSLKICLLAKHNKQVYAEHYDRILAKLV